MGEVEEGRALGRGEEVVLKGKGGRLIMAVPTRHPLAYHCLTSPKGDCPSSPFIIF